MRKQKNLSEKYTIYIETTQNYPVMLRYILVIIIFEISVLSTP